MRIFDNAIRSWRPPMKGSIRRADLQVGLRKQMLKGCVPWPAEFARRYIDAGLWEGITVAEMVEREIRPDTTNVVRLR